MTDDFKAIDSEEELTVEKVLQDSDQFKAVLDGLGIAHSTYHKRLVEGGVPDAVADEMVKILAGNQFNAMFHVHSPMFTMMMGGGQDA